MNKLQLTTAPELVGIETSKAQQIKKTFEPMVEMLETFENSFNLIMEEAELGITDEISDKARLLRISIAKVRTTTEKARKKEKEEYLRAGKAIDGVANLLKWAVTEKEEKLKDIEDYHARIEQEKKVKLQFERLELLKPFVGDDYHKELSSMDQDVFNAFLQTKKKDYEDLIAAEKKAEEDRIAKELAEAEERRLIRLDNEKLRKEAEARDKKEKIESDKRAKLEAERLAKEQAEQKKRDDQQRKEREAHEAELRLERERIAKLEADQLATRQAEFKAKQDEEIKKEQALKMGDADKFKSLIADLESLKTKYSFQSKENRGKLEDVKTLVDKIITHISK
jgi:hypothetical protein